MTASSSDSRVGKCMYTVARTTPARRAISAMLASGSIASASRAASMMAEMLRSASARRFRADALAGVFVFVLLIDQ